jgi:hypothetical protein
MAAMSPDFRAAVWAGDVDAVRALVEAGADVNAADDCGAGTLLCFHPAVTAYLLSRGADPNRQTNEYGASVLAGLCYVNQTDCVRLLLAHGADPNRGGTSRWRRRCTTPWPGGRRRADPAPDRPRGGSKREYLAGRLQLQLLRGHADARGNPAPPGGRVRPG